MILLVHLLSGVENSLSVKGLCLVRKFTNGACFAVHTHGRGMVIEILMKLWRPALPALLDHGISHARVGITRMNGEDVAATFASYFLVGIGAYRDSRNMLIGPGIGMVYHQSWSGWAKTSLIGLVRSGLAAWQCLLVMNTILNWNVSLDD